MKNIEYNFTDEDARKLVDEVVDIEHQFGLKDAEAVCVIQTAYTCGFKTTLQAVAAIKKLQNACGCEFVVAADMLKLKYARRRNGFTV